MTKANSTLASRRALLQGATALAILAPAATIAAAVPIDRPNDARLRVLVADYERVREEVCKIRDRSEELQRALGILLPPYIEHPNFFMEASEFFGEESRDMRLDRAWNEAEIVRHYESRITLGGEAWVEKRDQQLERFRKVEAEWHAGSR
jgi:hypothetical protein